MHGDELMNSVEEIEKFLLMPIECITENNRIFIYKDKIFSSQKYRGLDPDMSDLSIKFYEIIYHEQLGKSSLLEKDRLKNKQFCGDTMISNYSVEKLNEKDIASWDKTHRCLANFWILPMPVGHTSPRMVYEINDKKYGYIDLIFLSKSNSIIRDDMYKYLKAVTNENKEAMKEYYPAYWAAFGDNFQKKHYLEGIYTESAADYDSYRKSIEKRAKNISKDESLIEELSKLYDSIEK